MSSHVDSPLPRSAAPYVVRKYAALTGSGSRSGSKVSSPTSYGRPGSSDFGFLRSLSM